MPVMLRCPKGHQWEAVSGGKSTCPQCGSAPVRRDEAQRPTLKPDVSTPSLSQSMDRTSLPEQFGRYRIVKRLGKGGMGAVYLAHDSELDRQVALKVPHFTEDEGKAVRERFYREARSAATLHHANICPVYDVGEINGTLYLTMAFIEGDSLADFVDPRKRLTARQIATLLRKLAQALGEAHSRGVIHRDLKPSNVMISKRGEPVVMDFGLARRATQQDVRLTKSGTIMGTPAYMPPEQVNGDLEAMGPHSDLYSLGVILYELLAGRLPFEGPMASVLAQILTKEPQPPSKVRPDADPVLEAICLKAMAKDIHKRYASMGELAAALGDFLKATSGGGTVTKVRPDAAFADLTDDVRVLKTRTHKPASKPQLRSVSTRLQETLGTVPPKWRWIALAAAVSLFSVLAVVVYVATDHGTIKIELSDPNAKVEIKVDGTIDITNLDEPIKLKAGEHGLTVTGKNFETVAKSFTVKRGENPALRVELEAKNKPAVGTKSVEIPAPISNSIGMKLALIPAGKFVMGTPANEPGRGPQESPQRPVTITRPFYIGIHEVTQGQYQRVMGENPSRQGPDRTPDHPVDTVPWEKAAEFCRRLAELSEEERAGRSYRLPTEAEWEYACRAGTATAYSFGDDIREYSRYGWCRENSNGSQPVGLLKPNGFGLYDMHGNVKEWCADFFQPSYVGGTAPIDPTGPAQGDTRVIRGGSFVHPASLSRSATREYGADRPTYYDFGFRVVCEYSATPRSPAAPTKVQPRPPNAPADASEHGGKYHKVFVENLTWHEARKKCQEMGGDLAVVVDDAHNQFLQKLITAGQLQEAWLGATDEVKEGDWRWVNGSPLGYSNWFPGQPNNKQGLEHYLIMLANRDGKWSDQPDRSDQHRPGFICQWERDAPSKPRGAAEAPPTSSEFVSLFNGRDLTGWKVDSGPPSNWRWENDQLVATRGPGAAAGWLVTEKEYRDYTLRLQFQLTAGSQSGVAVRAPGDGSPRYLEVQLRDDTAAMTPNAIPTATLVWGAGAAFHSPTSPPGLKPVGEWNDLQITVRNQVLGVMINEKSGVGSPFFFFSSTDLAFYARQPGAVPDLQRASGRVGLQAQTGTVRFRNIEIQELAPTTPADKPQAVVQAPKPEAAQPDPSRAAVPFVPLFNRKDLTGWIQDGGAPGAWRAANAFGEQYLLFSVPSVGGPAANKVPPQNGWLLTEKSYADFVLRFEYRLDRQANSGITFRAQPGEKHIEIQLLDDDTVANTAQKPEQRSGSLWNLVPSKDVQLKGPSDWNQVELEIKGRNLRMTLNGRETLNVSLDQVNPPATGAAGLKRASGRIGFQHWSGTGRFRNIEIQDLSAGGSAARPSQPDGRGGFVRLFQNGLGDAQLEGTGGTWSFRDQVLVGATTAPQFAWLYTVAQFEDLVLRCQFQLERGAVAGVAVRAAPGFPQTFFPIERQVKVHLADDARSPAGSLFWGTGNQVERPDQNAELKPAGQWNHLELSLRGETLQVAINGKEVLRRDLARLAGRPGALPNLRQSRGRLGFLVHAGTVRFRDLEIQERPEPPAAKPAAKPASLPITLFDGSNLARWVQRDGQPPSWKLANGHMQVVRGDIRSKQEFAGDHEVHVEFLIPQPAAGARGQARGNSGVYIQGRYEVQILDSYGVAQPTVQDCGAIYGQHAPSINASKPADQWQTFDITFRAPQFAPNGTMTRKPRMTVVHNGKTVINNAEIEKPSGQALDAEMAKPGPLLLQDHGHPVQFRNIRVKLLE